MLPVFFTGVATDPFHLCYQDCIHPYTRCTYSQCMPRACILLTFEPTCDITVSRRGTSTVGQPVAWRIYGDGRRSWRQPCAFFVSLVAAPLSRTHQSGLRQGGGCIWTLCSCFRFRTSLLPLSSLLSSQISTILTSQQWDHSALGTINLRKVYTNFL